MSYIASLSNEKCPYYLLIRYRNYVFALWKKAQVTESGSCVMLAPQYTFVRIDLFLYVANTLDGMFVLSYVLRFSVCGKNITEAYAIL